MGQSSLNRRLNQLLGIFLGTGIALWILRGLEIFSFIPGGVILLLFLGAIAIAIIGFAQRTWWRI